MRQRQTRLATDIVAHGRMPASAIVGEVVDISADGCRVRGGVGQVQRGSTIMVCLLEDDLAGQVVWTDGKEFGVAFHRPLEPSALARLVEAAAP